MLQQSGKRWLSVLVLVTVALAATALRAADGGAYVNEADYKTNIRVACIGDSITFGAGVANREQNSYPVQLGKLLGDKYEVRNFGVSGSTLLSKGDKPYVKENAYAAAKEFKPHVVVIKLGTNDTKPQNWKHEADYAADYKAMIADVQTLDSKPRIWLCTPVPAYPGNWGIDDGRIKTGVLPKVQSLAKETGLPVVDLYQALSDKRAMFPDKVHPNADGAKLIAKTVYRALTGKDAGDK